jgi:hypothetical protein
MLSIQPPWSGGSAWLRSMSRAGIVDGVDVGHAKDGNTLVPLSAISLGVDGEPDPPPARPSIPAAAESGGEQPAVEQSGL